MKYEMIFGDEMLFDGAPEYATHATKGGGFYFIDTGVVKFISNMGFGARDVCELAGHLVAERRIIKEPKRWTWEDKKAGRLPEVGSLVEWNDCGVKLKVTIESAFFNKSCAFSFEGRGIGIAEIFDLSPIETPAEKAKREEDEFIGSLSGADIHDGTVKELFDQGARAAYRKLKGGE